DVDAQVVGVHLQLVTRDEATLLVDGQLDRGDLAVVLDGEVAVLLGGGAELHDGGRPLRLVVAAGTRGGLLDRGLAHVKTFRHQDSDVAGTTTSGYGVYLLQHHCVSSSGCSIYFSGDAEETACSIGIATELLDRALV